jgi:EAL domain-containing protein (putative c-di-GMP-specific phosphodiesterase class I)
MGDMEHTAQVLEALRAHGVGAAIDDFGTGYSSLTYLRRLPVQCLKIDQSFVADADVSPESATIIRAITAMARSLGLRTVAEGIERRSQRDLLREVGLRRGAGGTGSRGPCRWPGCSACSTARRCALLWTTELASRVRVGPRWVICVVSGTRID